MANYKKYTLPYATNYEVNSQGDVFNIKKNSKLTRRERVKITNNDGAQIWIYPIKEYNKLDQEDYRKRNRFAMSPEFPNYEIDKDGFVHNINNPDIALAWSGKDQVNIYNNFGTRVRVNVFKALAMYRYGQEDVGNVFVEFMFNAFGKSGMEIPCNHFELHENRIQIIHHSIEHRQVHLLRYYKGLCVLEHEDPNSMEVVECRTGQPVETYYNAHGTTIYKIPIKKMVQDRVTARYKYEQEVHVGLTLEQLKLDYNGHYYSSVAPLWESFF